MVVDLEHGRAQDLAKVITVRSLRCRFRWRRRDQRDPALEPHQQRGPSRSSIARLALTVRMDSVYSTITNRRVGW